VETGNFAILLNPRRTQASSDYVRLSLSLSLSVCRQVLFTRKLKEFTVKNMTDD